MGFCTKCLERESELEIMRNQHYKDSQYMKERIKTLQEENDRLRNMNDRLILDVAFYGGNVTNLSCNNK